MESLTISFSLFLQLLLQKPQCFKEAAKLLEVETPDEKSLLASIAT